MDADDAELCVEGEISALWDEVKVAKEGEGV